MLAGNATASLVNYTVWIYWVNAIVEIKSTEARKVVVVVFVTKTKAEPKLCRLTRPQRHSLAESVTAAMHKRFQRNAPEIVFPWCTSEYFEMMVWRDQIQAHAQRTSPLNRYSLGHGKVGGPLGIHPFCNCCELQRCSSFLSIFFDQMAKDSIEDDRTFDIERLRQ